MLRILLATSLCISACKTATVASDVKLVGGSEASVEEFPATFIWTTDNVRLAESYCTGSKVGEEWILTAAHCVLEQKPLPGETYIGPWKQIEHMAPGKKLRYSFSRMIDGNHREGKVTIEALILPPMVESCLADPEQNPTVCQYREPIPDVALVRVKAPARSQFRSAPIAHIDLSAVSPGEQVFMMGYGSEEESYQGPPRLKYAEATVSTEEEMVAALQTTDAQDDGFPDWTYFFGVASDPTVSGHKNLGFGDSGGPVYRKGSGGIIGVNSDGFCPQGNRNCSTTTNSTFARIDNVGMHGIGAWLYEHLND